MSFQSTKQSKQQSTKQSGFTLIELVVVVAVLAIVGVLIIPSVRTLNEDRKIRDTARVVGSVFASAREQAAVNGSSGVEIVSIPSNPGDAPASLRYNAPNMGLIVYELRGLPAYVGAIDGASATITEVVTNVIGSGANISYDTEFQISFVGAPFFEDGVRENDFLELNGNGVRYPIESIEGVTPAPNDPTDCLLYTSDAADE